MDPMTPSPNTRQATALLGLLTETSLHAGAGRMVGVIDLPIQREAHTGWPCVYGSAVKGALRTRAEGESWAVEVFGPETKNSSEHAGALMVSDARLLLLPVRSLTSHFKWVTCPALVHRFAADCRRLGLPGPPTVPTVDKEEALIPRSPDQATPATATGETAGQPASQGSADSNTNDDLYLEELRFTPKEEDLEDLISALAGVMARSDAADALRRQLVIVHDDLFALLSRFATPVAAHVRLDNQTKTVQTGALWYEETLPPDTVLYTSLIAAPSRRRGSSKSADEVLGHVTQDLFGAGQEYLQLGGNETVGMGWCRVQKVDTGAPSAGENEDAAHPNSEEE